MGYASTMIVVYGVELDDAEIGRLVAVMEDRGLEQNDYSPDMDPADVGEDDLYDVQVFAHDSDSRINSTTYDSECSPHSFGVLIATKGYVDLGNVTKAMRSPVPEQAARNWEKYCKPLLAEAKIKKEPSLHLVQQVW